jgi:hypothetical protein
MKILNIIYIKYNLRIFKNKLKDWKNYFEKL